MKRQGFPINSFTEPESEPELERLPTQTEMLMYATELLIATVHEATDKIAAAVMTTNKSDNAFVQYNHYHRLLDFMKESTEEAENDKGDENGEGKEEG